LILNLCFVSRETILCLIIFIKIKNVSRETFFKSLFYLIKNLLFWLILAKIITYPQFIHTVLKAIALVQRRHFSLVEIPEIEPRPQ